MAKLQAVIIFSAVMPNDPCEYRELAQLQVLPFSMVNGTCHCEHNRLHCKGQRHQLQSKFKDMLPVFSPGHVRMQHPRMHTWRLRRCALHTGATGRTQGALEAAAVHRLQTQC